MQRALRCLVAIVAASVLLVAPAAAETLRVGKAVPEAFSFVPLDIAVRKGFFAKYGIDIEESAFAGDARMQQAMASDSLDVALGSGPAMKIAIEPAAGRDFMALGIDLAAIETGAAFGIRQQVIGVVQLLKPFRGLFVARMQVRVMPLGEFAVGSLDRRFVGVARQAENFVRIPHDRAR